MHDFSLDKHAKTFSPEAERGLADSARDFNLSGGPFSFRGEELYDFFPF
jgi:hypothetical protein